MESPPINTVSSLPQFAGTGTPTLPSGKGKELEESCSDFISVLYTYVFGQMRNNEDAEEGSLFGGDHAQMMMGFMDQEMGKKLAKGEGNGLAKQLFWQLNKQNQAATQTPPPVQKET